jgi:DNA-binding IclR family transcriptional regulator
MTSVERALPARVGGAGGESSDGAAESSAGKTLALLEVVASAGGRTVGVTELARATRLHKSTAHRLLKELEQHDFVGRRGRKYLAGNSLLKLLETAIWSRYGRLRDLAVPTLSWLFEQANATVHLAVLEEDEVLYLEKITAAGGCRVPSRVGGRLPATCTALGKAMLSSSPPPVVRRVLDRPLLRLTPYSITARTLLLSELARARLEGLSREREEAALGFACLAAPVIVDGSPVAAVSVSHPVSSPFGDCDGRLVRAAADEIATLIRD